METTLARPRTRPKASNSDDGPDHIYHCDPNVSYCGLAITDLVENDGPRDNDCVVCEDEQLPCPVCGA